MPIVLTSNVVIRNPDHAWDDIEGVQYHYPNQYKNKIRAGERFVYYRGVHREDGRRAPAEYFGEGRIGAIRLDAATEGDSRPSWFCTIEDYRPFNPTVPAKVDEVFFEQIPPNAWRNGVRDLGEVAFNRILEAAGLAAQGEQEPAAPTEADNLIAPKAKVAAGGGKGGGYRRSKRAKAIGDWAEDAALRFIRNTLKTAAITHRAGIGETPGWDIDYVDSDGGVQRVEVKGTVGAAFTNIELTAGELRAAQTHSDAYWIFLVTGCLSAHPRVQRIRNPAARIESDAWTLTPILFSVSLS